MQPPLPLAAYDRILVALSGGKDSVACLLALLEVGADPVRIELHHHEVDGRGPSFMDWPSSAPYCRALAEAFGMPIYFSWRKGGFLREMLRQDAATAPIVFETPHGLDARGGDGPRNTRLRFPQVSADLSVRWCSAALKIGVMDTLIRAQDRFLGSRTLVVTGERAEESPARARYAPSERHRTDTRDGTRRQRHVDHWRPVHGWSERAVWDILARHGVVPAIPYRLGFGRLSCMTCIFGTPALWATIRLIARAWFERVAGYERQFGCTIQRARSVRDLADRGIPYPAALAQPGLVAEALTPRWTGPIRTADWRLPAGAFGEAAGPA
ncbi:phosphoadenosine phosphosulfate reductase family protein [Roseomonas gilardii]|uniref:phosphoadenosine phosphosulfate reductase domain-containing protein n=1 Tax=Roseomonas gilardii TaxID=257708 RepID=UPI0011A170BA|nr:phosphoadenosine phosphosulfate reductase family protein [Roseomonas gilardii]